MIEKVNPGHPDKLADRIAGAIVDFAYTMQDNPRIAVEVLLGHSVCYIIAETSCEIAEEHVAPIVHRIAGGMKTCFVCVKQDAILSQNQAERIRCGDNGIFKGVPLTDEQRSLSAIARDIYTAYPTDGKYILDANRLIICQSNADSDSLRVAYPQAKVNPLGDWVGGTDVDTGATNRKLGSDMADSITGGGLHGKDLSKADVSVNIYAFLKAQETGMVQEFCCAIGDNEVGGIPYSEMVSTARKYIEDLGGFEKFAEWGLY